MKIFEYSKVDWQQVLELNLTSFNWYLTPSLVSNIFNVDKRVAQYFAIYGVENGEVLGQVGILIDNTKTINGYERIGYLWALCTKPSAFRKRVATRLIEEAHLRLLADGVRYSFIGTQRSLIAYDLFKKIGYSDFINSNLALKNYEKHEINKTDVSFSTEYDEEMIFEIFSRYSQNMLGFICRPSNFISIRKVWAWMPINLIGVFQKKNKLIGYVLGIKEGKTIKIKELCCPIPEDIYGCIKALEFEFKPEHIVFDFISRYSIINNLINDGFRCINPTLSLYMIKDLKAIQEIDHTQYIYGIGNDKFHMTSIDDY